MRTRVRFLPIAMLAALFAAPAWAQQTQPAQQAQPDATIKRGGEIVTQPARDVGVARTKIPPVLEAAHEDPYGLAGLGRCRHLTQAITELNEVLGPDYTIGNEKKENRAGKLAEAGGKTVINAIIPFRGLVREVTGAAPAQRRLEAAIDAGFARRGFLRGVAYSRRCRL
ncbi:hypothetical protein PYV00_06940 [Novosphingobium sp. H3SJ31-1]|uniref:Uncharacterized protein n=2 Tax=Novosphingobium album (ex Liu et al. 2023) TaxID=3031130 RepID=A0ABT5WN36_9SPHN|nr:hypothetical protein [Novosphingobium album (ex Liu et al. 2023)]